MESSSSPTRTYEPRPALEKARKELATANGALDRALGAGDAKAIRSAADRIRTAAGTVLREARSYASTVRPADGTREAQS